MTSPEQVNFTTASVGGQTVQSSYNTTSSQVYDNWNTQMQFINAVLNIQGNPASTALNTAANRVTLVTNFQNAVNSLLNASLNGVQLVDSKGNPMTDSNGNPVLDYYTTNMNSDLDNFLRTLYATAPTGSPITGTPGNLQISQQAVMNWLDLANATPAVQQIVKNMNNEDVESPQYQESSIANLSALENSSGQLEVGSLQSMVELLYVQAGNNLMADNLDTLESAMNTNQQALTALTNLQNLHSQLAALPPGNQPLDTGSATGNDTGVDSGTITALKTGKNVSAYYSAILPQLGPGLADAYSIMQGYQNAAINAFQGNPLYPTGSTTPGFSSFADLLETMKLSFQNMTTVDSNTPPLNPLASPSTPQLNATLRANLVQAIADYNNVVIPYTNAINQLNTLIQPYVDIINGGPTNPVKPVTIQIRAFDSNGSPAFDSNGQPLFNSLTVPIPESDMPILPGFTSDQIPYPNLSSTGLFDFGNLNTYAPNVGTDAQVQNFVTTQLLPFMDKLGFNNGEFPGLGTVQVAGVGGLATLNTPLQLSPSNRAPGLYTGWTPTTALAPFVGGSFNTQTQIGGTDPALVQTLSGTNPLETTSTSIIGSSNNTGNTGLQFATQFYGQYGQLFANGNGTKGPLEAFTLATQAQQEYQALQQQIATLSKDPVQTSSPNTLLGQLKQVVADLQTSGIANLPNVSGFGDLSQGGQNPTQVQNIVQGITAFANQWVLDNLNNSASSSSGKIQQDIDAAMTASQSLNSQQQAKTSNFLFLFQEFYQSASSILKAITDLLTKMADNINR